MAHVGRRFAVSATERLIEVGNIVKARIERNRPNRPIGKRCIAQLAVDQRKPQRPLPDDKLIIVPPPVKVAA